MKSIFELAGEAGLEEEYYDKYERDLYKVCKALVAVVDASHASSEVNISVGATTLDVQDAHNTLSDTLLELETTACKAVEFLVLEWLELTQKELKENQDA